MDADSSSSSSSPRSLQPNGSSACTSTGPFNHDSNVTVHNHFTPSKLHIRKKKKKAVDRDAPSSSSCSASSSHKGTRLPSKRRTLRVRFGSVQRPEVRDVDSIALPLGMSFAAVVAQVLEKTDVSNERLPPDYLSVICTSAVRESLSNVFGDKFDCFVRNFEKSFGSTLRTLRLINDSSKHKEKYLSNPHNVESSTSDETTSRRCYRNSNDKNDSYSDVDLPSVSTRNQLNIHEDVHENIQTGSLNRELAIHGQVSQMVCVNPRTGFNADLSMVTTIEKSVIEQVRSNDLKTLELSLTMRKLKLKEEQLALNSDLNHLERSKLAMGISKASFKAEKFKSQLEDTRHGELLKKCIDFLVAGLLIMSFLLIYGAYVYSYKRITDATSSCNLSFEKSKPWWIPKQVSSFNSGLNILKCQVQVVTRMIFGLMLILAVAYLLIQRSGTSKQTMPVTFILLLLGIACGLAGKFCVDTLGGNGYYWLFYWEILCLLHFLSNVFTSVLFIILYGPVNISQRTRSTLLPYWIRRSIFYSMMLFVLPLLCGLMPFASPSEWKDHFLLLVLGDGEGI
ncbi:HYPERSENESCENCE 1, CONSTITUTIVE EXPRESSION OF PR GENES 5, ONSET OF LEAF DEATH 1 [Hibiscus trionum]|uniref:HYPERSENESCENCE 1, CONSTITUTIVE EXPRESSION OF PR GENES 5, ONSET OF LEAF DEATH 1 n=1 Tax=Hibiscus trionum TaxID=183268 RepID=A0A9W7M3K0_HIBTR|nr:HYPERSENESCENCE 1, CONSTITUTIVE EXPRESSION OF PR GENES 5, ONSET OF LEAF DEATH 1 [Hibiscus trionum]